MTKDGVALPVMNGGQRIPSTNGGLWDFVAAAPIIGLLGVWRMTTSLEFFRPTLDLRFPAIWFLLVIFIAGEVTRIFLDQEAVTARKGATNKIQCLIHLFSHCRPKTRDG